MEQSIIEKLLQRKVRYLVSNTSSENMYRKSFQKTSNSSVSNRVSTFVPSKIVKSMKFLGVDKKFNEQKKSIQSSMENNSNKFNKNILVKSKKIMFNNQRNNDLEEIQNIADKVNNKIASSQAVFGTENKIVSKKEQVIFYDDSLFENEIIKSKIHELEKHFVYRDIKLYLNLFQEYKKNNCLEINSYWMGYLDCAIESEFDDLDCKKLLENDNFIHNLQFCLILFVPNLEIQELIKKSVSFPLIICPIKKFSYFTNNTDLLFEWNEKLELFTIGYEFDIQHYIEAVPPFFKKNWILFEKDVPLKLSDFLFDSYGNDWKSYIKEKFNVNVIFLKSDTVEQKKNSYEVCFKFYKQCIFYISYHSKNTQKTKNNWYYECFENATPIFTTDKSEFICVDVLDNYNLFNDIDDISSVGYIRNIFNGKNIEKMSSYIYRWNPYLFVNKNNILDYFKYVHYTLFKKQKKIKQVLNDTYSLFPMY